MQVVVAGVALGSESRELFEQAKLLGLGLNELAQELVDLGLERVALGAQRLAFVGELLELLPPFGMRALDLLGESSVDAEQVLVVGNLALVLFRLLAQLALGESLGRRALVEHSLSKPIRSEKKSLIEL